MNIEDIIKEFLKDIKYIQIFITENWGIHNIFERKNKGDIPNVDFNIKDSLIKGYSFHGCGCLFKFKNKSVDVELLDNTLSFTLWSVKVFVYNYIKDIDDDLISKELSKLVKNNILDELNNNFTLTGTQKIL